MYEYVAFLNLVPDIFHQELRESLVDPLPVGSKLVVNQKPTHLPALFDGLRQAVFDSCHSASLLGMTLLPCHYFLTQILLFRSQSFSLQPSIRSLDLQRTAKDKLDVERHWYVTLTPESLPRLSKLVQFAGMHFLLPPQLLNPPPE